MSNKEETSKAKKGKEAANKKEKNAEKDSIKGKKQIKKSKEKEKNTAVKETKEISQKEREYIKAIENLTQKIKNIEQNTENEENKLSAKNTEKQNRLQMLTSSNEKIKQTLGILTDKIEQMKQNIEMEKEKEEKERLERLEKNKKKGNKKDKNENIEKGPFAEQDQDIKEKQDLIINLSKENRELKKSIDHFYELSTHNKFYVELKEKEGIQKKLEKEIKSYEEIINKHRKECTKTINKLEKDLGNLKNKLYLQNREYHTKNKDYFYIQSKFSLQKKEDEKYYQQIKNKKNYLDLQKNIYLIDPESERVENIKINLAKKKKLARNVENGLIESFEITHLPKIDVNHEGKIISSIFTKDEMEKIKSLLDEEKYQNFEQKVLELEKGGNTEANSEKDLKKEFSGLEKELLEQEEVALMEKYKLKDKVLEINKVKQAYRNSLTKNINLKKEEKSLKEKLERLQYRYSLMLKQQKAYSEMNQYIDGLNDIVTGPDKNNEKANEENKNNINENDIKQEGNEEGEAEGEEAYTQNEERYEESEDE